MAEQFTIKKEDFGTLYSCEKYSCFVRGTVLDEVTINEDIKELYVPEGVTIFAPSIGSIKDCKVQRIILPSSLKKLDCSSFSLHSLQRYYCTIDIDEIEIPSFSVVFANTEELNWNQPFVVCKDSSFRLNISCLLALKSQFPNAFSDNGQGKCFFDNVWNDEYWEYRSLDEDSVISIGIWGREELIVPEICKQGEDAKKKQIIACCFNYAPKRIYFPKTVQYVAFCYEGKETKFELFDFAGKLPSFAECNSGIDGAKLELLRINAPVAETDVPTLLKIMLEDAIDTGRIKYNGKVIFAAPALCEEDSSVPGYIRVTARLRNKYRLIDQISGKDKDIIVSLNTRYIGSVEPFDIETYTPCVGSLVHIVTTGVETHYTYVVYEPVETIMEKIRQTREYLDLESMIDRIREVLPKEIRE